MNLLRRYFALLEKRPLPTKVISAIVIFSSSDGVYNFAMQCIASSDLQYAWFHYVFIVVTIDIVLSFAVIAQVYENADNHNFDGSPLRDFAWDAHRTMRITAFGGVVTCWLHVWWNTLERVVEKTISSSTHHYSNALTKVFLDQAIGAPIFNVLFFSSQQLLQGKPFDKSLFDTGK